MPEIPAHQPTADAALSVVMVATDSTSSLADLVQAWSTFLTAAKREHEIIVVVEREEEAKDLTPAVRVVVEKSAGQGARLRQGIQAARLPLVLYLPAEPEWRPDLLQPLLERIDPVDLVSGCRAGRQAPAPLRGLGAVYRTVVRVLLGIPLEPWPGWLGWRGYLYQRCIRILFGTRLSDVACPFKLFRRQALQRMPIQSAGSFVHTELMAKANFLSCLVDEAPLPVPARESSERWWTDFRQVFFHPDFGRTT